MMNVQLSTNRTLRGKWLNLPATFEQIQQVFDTLTDEGHPTLIIAAAESNVAHLCNYLIDKIVDRDQGLRELDFLNRRIEGLTNQEKNVLGAALDIENPHSLMEMVNLSCNLDKFALYADVINYEELGQAVLEQEKIEIPEELRQCVDYERKGISYAANHAGTFSASGYVVRTGEALTPLYDGRHLPDPAYDRTSVFLIRLYSSSYANGHPGTYALSLPVSEEKLALARENLGVKDLGECSIIDMSSTVQGLENRLPCSYTVAELNDFAELLTEDVLDGTEETAERLMAALAAELPEDMAAAVRTAEDLAHYEVLPENIQTPADYAGYVMQDAGIYVSDEIAPFVDYEAFGANQMQEDGVVQTVHGMVLRDDRPIHQLPEELTTVKLFSPLYPQLYERSEWGDLENEPVDMGADELCAYEDKILEALERECLDSEGDRGLAVYLDNELLKRKVHSMNPTVEEWNGRLWGVLEVQSHGELSPAELAGVIEEWSGQESDGWGEGFEQREIKIDQGELCVSFWAANKGFFIKTEQELKSQPEQGFGMQMGGM